MAKQLSRQKRLDRAVASLEKGIGSMRDLMNDLEEGKSELEELKDEYEEWKDNLPENLQGSALGDKLEEVINLLEDFDFIDEIDSALTEAENKIAEIEGADLPLGFGRD